MPREELYARCDARFDIMLERGAIEEVKGLLDKGYASHLPVMKAVGACGIYEENSFVAAFGLLSSFWKSSLPAIC